MRFLYAVVLLAMGCMLSICANGQPQWSITLPVFLEKAAVTDAQILQNGETILIFNSTHKNDTNRITSAHTWLTRLSNTGQILSTTPIIDGSRQVGGMTLVKGTGTTPFHLLALGFDSLTHSQYGISQFPIDAEGHLGNGAHHVIQGGNYDVYFNNAALDQDSALFLTGGVNMDYSNSVSDKILLLRLAQGGTELAQSVLPNGSIFAQGINVARSGDEMLVAAVGGSFGPFGVTRYMRFNLNLEYQGGFVGLPVSGGEPTLQPDSILRDIIFMSPLPSGSMIISGRFGSLSLDNGLRYVATRIAATGELETVFIPQPETLFEYSGILQSHDVEPNGTRVAAVVQNFNPWNFAMSTTPSRIHIYQLDTMLNVLCDQVAVDGAEDGSYYMLNRVKATPDGGTLLMGSKMNVNTQSLPQPWIMKIAPWDCQSGIGEHEAESTATVWPNPGSTGFTAFVNGPVVARGTLELYNAQGQLATSTDVLQSSATVNATNLAPGVYLYRITDGQGALRATGRWVKE